MEQPVFTGDTIPTLMNSVERAFALVALEEARQLLNAKKQELVHGPYFPWSVLNDAASHVDQQITALYKSYLVPEISPSAIAALKDEAGIEAEL
jgi:hypothetical protein